MSRVEEFLPLIDQILKYKFPSFAFKESYLCKIHAIEYGDLHSVGAIGLMKADHTYDEGRGVQFKTHAFRYIHSEIIHFLRDNNYCSTFPRTVKEVADRVVKYRDELTPELIMELEDVDRDMALDVYGYLNRKKYSLDKKVPDKRAVEQEEWTYKDLLPDRMNVEFQVIRKIEFEDKMGMLSESAHYIFSLSLGGTTQMEIAQITGLSQSRISRIIKNSVKMMNEAYT